MLNVNGPFPYVNATFASHSGIVVQHRRLARAVERRLADELPTITSSR